MEWFRYFSQPHWGAFGCPNGENKLYSPRSLEPTPGPLGVTVSEDLIMLEPETQKMDVKEGQTYSLLNGQIYNFCMKPGKLI